MNRFVVAAVLAFLLGSQIVPVVSAADPPTVPCTYDDLAAQLLGGGPVFHEANQFHVSFTEVSWARYAQMVGYSGSNEMLAFAEWLQNEFGGSAVFIAGGYTVTFVESVFKSPCPPPGAPAGNPAPKPSRGDPFGLLGVLLALALGLIIFGGRRRPLPA